MQDFHTLQVWKKAHQLTLRIYQITKTLPSEERYELSRQIQRCCTSIPTNIAEGCGRNSRAEFAHYCSIAIGSACELEYHLLLIKDLHFLNLQNFEDLTQDVKEIKRMLCALHQKLQHADSG